MITGSNADILLDDGGNSRFNISGSNVSLETNKFFLGKKGSQFVSGSNGNIEISSSAFHLDTVNNTMKMSGSITATDGEIGGWQIESDGIKTNNITMSVADTYGHIALGNPPPPTNTQDTTAAGIYLHGRGGFVMGDFDGPRIAYDSSTSELTLSSSKFMLGDKGSTFVSGSMSNIEISSSKFHLKPDGDLITNDITASNVSMSGVIQAIKGNIGAWSIGSTSITRPTNLILGTRGSDEWGLFLDDDGDGDNHWYIDEGDNDKVTFSVGGEDGIQYSTATGFVKVGTDVKVSGSLKATAGFIGGWGISSAEINSNTSDFRGIKLIPDDKIVGYGTTNHSNKSSTGLFVFGVAAAVPPPGEGIL